MTERTETGAGYSRFSALVTENGETVRVDICPCTEGIGWALTVTDRDGVTRVLPDSFPTHGDALTTVQQIMRRDGLAEFRDVGDPGEPRG